MKQVAWLTSQFNRTSYIVACTDCHSIFTFFLPLDIFSDKLTMVISNTEGLTINYLLCRILSQHLFKTISKRTGNVNIRCSLFVLHGNTLKIMVFAKSPFKTTVCTKSRSVWMQLLDSWPQTTVYSHILTLLSLSNIQYNAL